jgi:hypothetical protein
MRDKKEEEKKEGPAGRHVRPPPKKKGKKKELVLGMVESVMPLIANHDYAPRGRTDPPTTRHDTTLGRQCRLPSAQTDARGGRGGKEGRKRERKMEREEKEGDMYICMYEA